MEYRVSLGYDDEPDRVYKGFNRIPSTIQSPFQTIALVWFDGEVDLFNVDGPEAEAEIIRLYKDDYERGPDSITYYQYARQSSKWDWDTFFISFLIGLAAGGFYVILLLALFPPPR